MHSQGQEDTRSVPGNVVERRRADDAVRPFISNIGTWNAKAANLKARAYSYYATEEERSLARLESGALLAEVRHRQSDFRSAIKGEPPHSRLDDIATAFERLIDQLEQISRSHLRS
jgi:hypothetical protein